MIRKVSIFGGYYFFCPTCSDDHIMRILDYNVVNDEPGNAYNPQMHSKAVRTFTMEFKVHCEQCGLNDFVKVSNGGWQGGTYADALRRTGGYAGDR